MKTSLKSLMLIATLVSTHAFADEAAGQRLPLDLCQLKIGLSLEQKGEIARINRAQEQAAKPLENELRRAGARIQQLKLEVNSTKEEMIIALQALNEKSTQLNELRSASDLDIKFDVMSPEQRVKHARCELTLKKPVLKPIGRHPHRPVILRGHHRPHRPLRIRHARPYRPVVVRGHAPHHHPRHVPRHQHPRPRKVVR